MNRAPLSRSDGKASQTAKLKPKKCRICREQFTPARRLQPVCSIGCAVGLVDKLKAKAAAKALAEDKRQTREKLNGMKKLSELRAEAQAAFNVFIRWRDRLAGYGCICCGQPLDWSAGIGGQVDAGHFLSRGSAPELAFDERNVNAQRKGCNRAGGTTRAKFRAGMIARYGDAVVAELEGPHETPHYKHDDYRRMTDHYKAVVRNLKKDQP